MSGPVALTWGLHEFTGWGRVGIELASRLPAYGWQPLALGGSGLLEAETRRMLAPILDGSRPMRDAVMAAVGPTRLDIPVLHALGNAFVRAPKFEGFAGRTDIGIIAFEDTGLDAAAQARARSYARMIVHSSFNRAVLAELGIRSGVAFQGVDCGRYRPLPRRGLFPGRFVVFSGGKLEFRKGQDLVIEGFRLFQRRHPEALLIAAWHSPWADLASGMTESPLVRVAPRIGGDGRIDMTNWARIHGISANSFRDLGPLTRDEIPAILAECDAAILPSRCEGATNLVAMEAMACKVPCVLSANTGHLDLIQDGTCYPRLRQRPCAETNAGTRHGWGESDPDEIAQALESIHADRAEAGRRAEAAMAFIRERHTWERFVRIMAAILDGEPDPEKSVIDPFPWP